MVPIMKNLQIPIDFIGIGEQKEDIESFNIEEFLEALFAEQPLFSQSQE